MPTRVQVIHEAPETIEENEPTLQSGELGHGDTAALLSLCGLRSSC